MKNEIMVQSRCMGGVLAVFLAAACTNAADPAENTVASSPTSAEAGVSFSQEGLAALDELLAGYVEAGQVAGIEALFVQDGEVVYSAAHGLRDVEEQTPLGEDTIWRIYSMTKPVTSVALMQLYEDGKFELDDPLSDYIPEFENLQVLAGENEDGTPVLEPLKREPTIRDAMRHTAGFAYGLFGQDYANRQFRETGILRSQDLDMLVDKVADVPLLFQPGEQWSYSVSVDIQGYLIEQFSGMGLGEYLDAKIFSPLGMNDTGFFVPDSDYERFADLMVWSAEAGRFVPVPEDGDSQGALPYLYREETVPFESGGHGLVSTIDDYARFSQMMLNGGSLDGAEIISPETVDLMTRDQLPKDLGIGFNGTARATMTAEPHKFGLGWGVISDPDAMASPAGAGTYYWGGAAGTWFWIDPVNDLYFIGMIQRFGDNPGMPFEPRAQSMALVYQTLQE
ncbi:serine hydrolase domain-containing protein [Henriciella barbarensis]|uniref:serine hydrolase domain-containing protein n=1 Tax=Henriciella barbarensis TaxID=86342 RepID=UPI0011C47AC4|nr:serine hydrolase domain-containing protein [Henriciella barbarensis]